MVYNNKNGRKWTAVNGSEILFSFFAVAADRVGHHYSMLYCSYGIQKDP